MSQVILKGVEKAYQTQQVLHHIDLEIPDGSFTVLVGPSGCGKSTTLRMIAGLEEVTSGQIYIGGRKVNELPAGKREVAMVFQNYALYPTMTVFDNIAFGLKMKKVPKKERTDRVEEIAEVVGLTDYLKRKPATLSGGQRQRVALARAMVKKPKVFLMDEPLSNLDAKLRYQMRMELTELHRKLGTTFIYVTHDQVEAMTMGDQIVVMDQGRVQQAAAPIDLYKRAANRFVSQFIGTPPMNVLSAGLLESEGHPWPLEYEAGEVEFGFRAEKVQLYGSGILPQEFPYTGLWLKGKVTSIEVLGAESFVHLETSAGKVVAKHTELSTLPSNGQVVTAFVPKEALQLFDRETGKTLQFAEGDKSLEAADALRWHTHA